LAKAGTNQHQGGGSFSGPPLFLFSWFTASSIVHRFPVQPRANSKKRAGPTGLQPRSCEKSNSQLGVSSVLLQALGPALDHFNAGMIDIAELLQTSEWNFA
jgi:hypothetical protein